MELPVSHIVDFWEELTKGRTLNLPNSNETQPEDIDPEMSFEDVVADDSDLTILALIGVMTGGELPDNVGIQDGGGLISIAESENVDLQLESEEVNLEENLETKPEENHLKHAEGSRGKRMKLLTKNTQHSGGTMMKMTGGIMDCFLVTKCHFNTYKYNNYIIK